MQNVDDEKRETLSDLPGFALFVETHGRASLQRSCVSTTAVRLYNNLYRLTNVFVTIPASVVTRTKYMPLARPETLMRVGFSTTFMVLMSLP